MPDTRLVLGSANFKSRPIVTPPFSNATNRGKHPNVARLGGHAVTRYSFDEGETVEVGEAGIAVDYAMRHQRRVQLG